MWLRRINDSGNEFRYELETFYTAPLLMDDFMQTQMFPLLKYWKNNNGEFQLCKCNEKVYVTVEMLLSNFVAIDSNVDKKIKDLEQFKQNVQANNLENSLKPFVLGDVENVPTDDANITQQVTNLDNDVYN
jgi:hypothetical protein